MTVIKKNIGKDTIREAWVEATEIYANTAEITAGVSTTDCSPGSVMINTQTGDAYLLTELTDGTKSWNAI